jgi:hypothetical protein
VGNRVEPKADVQVGAARASLRPCNRCGAVPTEIQTLLDSRKGKSIRIMRCKCGEQTWSEDA